MKLNTQRCLLLVLAIGLGSVAKASEDPPTNMCLAQIQILRNLLSNLKSHYTGYVYYKEKNPQWSGETYYFQSDVQEEMRVIRERYVADFSPSQDEILFYLMSNFTIDLKTQGIMYSGHDVKKKIDVIARGLTRRCQIEK